MKTRGRKSINRGKWQIERERLHITDTRRQEYDRDPNPLGQVLPEIMQRFGLKEQLWLEKLSEEWGNLVGDDIAKHARPGRFENSTLHVFVDSSVWLNELSRYSSKKITSKLQEYFGKSKIKSLKFQLDPEGKKSKPKD